jgi:hypothetical protein
MIDDEIADQPGLVMLGQVDYCSYSVGFLFFLFLFFFWVCSWFDDGHLNVNYSFVFSLVVLSSGVADAFLEIRTVSLQPTAHVHDQLSAVGRRSIGRLILPSQVSAFVV